ncbi:MAG: squalene/phytoene synthase family protein [Verrucomicrobia subdivision 3 bacterium]|nr:squalene/phytoene synthase family protein [Limisphaerales bacterium]
MSRCESETVSAPAHFLTFSLSHRGSSKLLTTVLREVSRSFYLTMRVLPGSIRRQIGLAYLLARTTDTITDTELVPVHRRLDALARLRERILGASEQRLDFSEFTQTIPGPPAPLLAHCENALRNIEYDKLTDPQKVSREGSPAERVLLQRIEEMLGVLKTFSESDQQLIRQVLATIVSGQELDLQRFGAASPNASTLQPVIRALDTMEQLDDYTYRVAGCVGEFWTRICRAHVFPRASLDDSQLLADAVRFGKGLQLVNVLRDLPADLRNSRCYLPQNELAGLGMTPADLLNPKNETRLRPLYNALLDRTEEHLRAAWRYTQALPRSSARVRLACAWPILIGVRTLAKLRAHNVLSPTQRIKISRDDVKRIMVRSIILYPFGRAWGDLYQRALVSSD